MKLWQSEAGEGGMEQRVERFTAAEDLRYDQALIRCDILGSIAHSKMLSEIGILSDGEYAELHEALLEIWDEGVTLSVEEEDVHTAVENRLIERLGSLGEKLHTGRSRNDQVLVDTRLHTKEALIRVAFGVLSSVESLMGVAEEHRETPMPGYTHMRRAMLSSVGHWSASFAEALLDHLGLIEAAYELNDQNPLGAAAGYGAPLAVDRDRTSELLGFQRVQNNTLYAINSRGMIEFSVLSALGSLMLTLSRLAEDLILFSTEEFGFFALPPGLTTGSSMMPQKQNPDVAELIRGRSSAVLADLLHVALVGKNLASGYHRDTQETKVALIRGLATTREILEMVPPLVDGIEVDREALRNGLSSDLFATDEIYSLVGQGVPFREAYRRVRRDPQTDAEARDAEGRLEERTAQGSPGNLRLGGIAERTEARAGYWAAEESRLRKTWDRLIRPQNESEKGG